MRTETKICTKCKIEKQLLCFHLEKRRGGYRAICKECHSALAKEWRDANTDRQSETSRSWYENNKERKANRARLLRNSDKEAARRKEREKYARNKQRINKYQALWRAKNKEGLNKVRSKWIESNREKIREQGRIVAKKRRSTPNGHLNANVSGAISASLRGNKNGRSWETLVGFTLNQLKVHLEKQFVDGMTWENYGPEWHIDHIIPKSVFNFTIPEHIDFKRCWSLKNLQPLWAKENLVKYNKLEKPFQPSLPISLVLDSP